MKSRKYILAEKFFFFCVVAVFLLAATSAYSDIYRYTDPEGVIHLTNVPTDNGAPYVLVMREKRVLLKAPGKISAYESLINQASEKYAVDSTLVKAVIKAESNFNHKAVSPVGARGLMQLMPATAASLQVADSFHPESNIDGGVRYLRYLSTLFKGNLPLVLAAYNAGENAVLRYNNSIPPYKETQTYVKRVLHYLEQYRNEKN
ncbi:MAG: lytic transglycosylase domain-containing protein [Syntrophales bacterium]|jgi:soluble lytic murein transglycosylase-like protein|nr:lytic transglycosylase domain-containing protein [Syntrophales bacterium]